MSLSLGFRFGHSFCQRISPDSRAPANTFFLFTPHLTPRAPSTRGLLQRLHCHAPDQTTTQHQQIQTNSSGLPRQISMFRQLALSTALLSTTLWQRAVAVDETRQPEKIAQLDTAATQLDRLKILPNNEDWVFDFTAQQPWYNWSPGGVTNMNAATFPAARGNGLTREHVPARLLHSFIN